jgi:hypothetical protein
MFLEASVVDTFLLGRSDLISTLPSYYRKTNPSLPVEQFSCYYKLDMDRNPMPYTLTIL